MLGTASRRAVSFASAQCKHVARAGGAVPVEGTGRRAASFVKGEANPEQDVSELYEYPRRKFNFGVNTCEQGHNHVVQRFGKFKRVVTSGLYFALPFIDTIVTHDMRERTILISPQSGVTRDNVYLKVSGVLFVEVTDAVDATYGVQQPLLSVVKAAEAAMRNALGGMDMDECFREKDVLNQAVIKALRATTATWGLHAKRYEVTDIDAAPEIKAAMNLQAAAERQRRETALGADATADVMQKTAKAQKQKDTDESLGIRARRINEAEGEAEAIRMRADADRHRIVQEADATSEAYVKIATVLTRVMEQPNGEQALRFMLVKDYTQMFGGVAGKSNTMFMGQDMGDIPRVLAKGFAAMDSLGAAGVLAPNKPSGQ